MISPLSSTSTNTHLNTYTHSHSDTHLGLMHLFQHSGLHDILFPKNHSCVLFLLQALQPHPLLPSLLSRQGSFMEEWLNLPPESCLGETRMEEASPRGSRTCPSWPWLLLSLTSYCKHHHQSTHTHSHSQSLMPQSQSLGYPTLSSLGSMFVPLSFSGTCIEAAAWTL